MSFPPVFAGRRYAVLGLGRNGLPAARALCAMGADVLAWDDSAAARAAAVPSGLPLGDPRDTDWRFDGLVLSPGIPHHLPAPHAIAAEAAARGVPILSDADLLYEAVRAAGSRARFAGITGTNGKSTTTALLAHILATAGAPCAAGGNLGPAALALPLLGDDGVYVLEMSSYMLERIAAIRFDVATMLNLSADHLDRHGNMTGYITAKLALFDRQRAQDRAVLGVDDAFCREIAAARPRAITVSGTGPADVCCLGGVLRDGDGPLLDLAEAPALPGAHNAQNAAAAFAMARALGIGRDAVAAGLRGFAGLPHRQERIGGAAGVCFVNDSKATNADSTARALACYDRVVWIAGGIAKAGGIAALAPFFPRIDEALLIGRDAPLLAATLRAHGVPHRILGTLEAAVPAALQAARRGGGTVLLSPACASFDQFSGFEARGERFRALVQDLACGSAA